MADAVDWCAVCGYYQKHVSLQDPSMHQSMHLSVHGMTGSCALGRFPTTFQGLLEAQQANSHMNKLITAVTYGPHPTNATVLASDKSNLLHQPGQKPCQKDGDSDSGVVTWCQ